MNRAKSRLQDARERLSGRDLIWAVIRELERECDWWTISQLVISCRKLPRGTVESYVQGLRKAGFVGQVNTPAPGEELRLKLQRDVGVSAPRVRKDGTLLPPPGRERMWKSMKILKDFNIVELRCTASQGGPAVSHGDADHYCRLLCHAGYLQRLAPNRYRLIPAMATGAHAPQILRIRSVYDPNLDRIMWTSEASVEGGE